MRILMLGAGAIGGYFGGRLAAGGADVTFLVRPRRAAQLASNGLVIHSPRGDLSLPVKTTERPEGPYDVVILSCKAYDLDDAMDSVAPAVGENTLLLPLLNGLRHLEQLDQRFGSKRVLGGLCQIGVTLTPEGEIRHLNNLQHFALGARTPDQQAGAEAVHRALEAGGFKPGLSADIMQEMWEKFVFITTYAGITCLMRAPIGAIASADDGQAMGLELLAECSAVATAAGHAPRDAFNERSKGQLTDTSSPGTASMLRDIQTGGRIEQDHIVGDMYARARAGGIAAPVLRTVRVSLQAYEIARERFAKPAKG